MTNLYFPWLLFSVLVFGGCATDRVISYRSDIDPVLQNKCRQCHLPPSGPGYIQTGLNMASYDTMMDGTMFGAVIIPGDSKRSVINKLIEGRAGSKMTVPHNNAGMLSKEEIKFIRLWVDQGAINN